MNLKFFVIFLTAVCFPVCASAGFITSFQGAAVYTARNDVELPGDGGSRFSYKNDLDSGVVFSPRFEAGYEFSGRHYAGVMASLLRFNDSGTLNRNIAFDNKTFAAGTEVKGRYRFDSYRATYRYIFLNSGSFKTGAGITGKIRDAEISLEGGGQTGRLGNTGFVPLLNYYMEWIISPEFSLLTYGDAAWSPYGRAEDIFAGFMCRFNGSTAVMAGYRMLEGGADNKTVYTFSMFHYAVLGVELRF